MIEEIPEHWRWEKAEDVCDYIQRGKQPEYSEDGEVQIINQKCIYWDDIYLENARRLAESHRPKWQEYRYLQKGDVLVNSTGVGTVGRAQVFPGSDEPFVVDGHVTIMRTSDTLLPRFLWYFLRSESGQDQINAAGSTGQIELRKKDVLDMNIPVPPIEEQERIVNNLGSLFEKIEDAKEAKERLEEIIEILPQSVLNKTLRGELAEFDEEDTFPGEQDDQSAIQEFQ
ncbi:restriction endonuclease subunit S [Natribaculum luteum]|uniref:Restriction endonuclease subunit S n=1 Tax=Natribaculum luteum TaxID=1586232 RepID=A0ABD5P2F9_9EURY|nr:restriction endonuclease subunit S [Natribaculum luteum]